MITISGFHCKCWRNSESLKEGENIIARNVNFCCGRLNLNQSSVKILSNDPVPEKMTKNRNDYYRDRAGFPNQGSADSSGSTKY